MEQLRENIDALDDFGGLRDNETEMLLKAAELIRKNIAIPCTGCSYCTDGCPMQIAIPKYFSLYNSDMQEREGKGWTPNGLYYQKLAQTHGRAGDCVGCGQCESVCPQKLPIIEDLKKVAEHFE